MNFLSAAPVMLGLSCLPVQTALADSDAEAPFVSGTLSFVADTHFISYGQDVWGAGNEWNDVLFHPSLELTFDLGRGFKGILGTWWDVNDNAATSIGRKDVQEIDVWVGLGYEVQNFTFTLLYQEWMYGGQNERIVDFKVGYAHWLNPSLTLHARVDDELPFDTGLVTVLGVAPSKEFGIVTVSVPVNVSFDTDNYHGGDAGFGFVSIGVSAGVPLTFVKGNWSLNAGITYYHTNDKVIPVNPDEDFVTGSLGVSLAF
ncbi:MAG TPA: hypothetical protein GYA07_06155 [Verrucomicrobia bacterium]|nr:hypothetical protein [Verrucomicrobiota bacterium]HOP97588.1 hypothetical protein [Verrucomicrobiota bacterium]